MIHVIACNVGTYESTPEWEWIVVRPGRDSDNYEIRHTRLEPRATRFPSDIVAQLWVGMILKSHGYAFRSLLVRPAGEQERT